MFRKILEVHQNKTGTGAIEKAKIERLEQAERDLLALKVRAVRAIGALEIRQDQNHWGDSIQKMIQGV